MKLNRDGTAQLESGDIIYRSPNGIIYVKQDAYIFSSAGSTPVSWMKRPFNYIRNSTDGVDDSGFFWRRYEPLAPRLRIGV